ncbi:MAG: DUF2073 domain-containing protein [Euryarchaeota archaeon]|nr:DUF2073 domain-containing protein [Euryarchaeota archaeon]
MDGLQINLISEDMLQNMTPMEKVGLIMENVIGGHIVVLESGLTPDEYNKLMERTMSEIRATNFPGIEVGSYPYKHKFSIFRKLLNRPLTETRMTLIGRSDRLKTIKRDRDFISVGLVSPDAPQGKKAKA